MLHQRPLADDCVTPQLSLIKPMCAHRPGGDSDLHAQAHGWPLRVLHQAVSTALLQGTRSTQAASPSCSVYIQISGNLQHL